jgi:ABC-type nickel/cobalt efflux system permease component RcnA
VKVSEKISYNHSPIVLAVALVAGLGVVLMITALGIGVIQGTAADSNAVGLLLAGGVVLFLLGAGAWFAVTQPQKHFDDISKPIDTDPHHGHHDEHPAPDEHVESEHQPAGH